LYACRAWQPRSPTDPLTDELAEQAAVKRGIAAADR
jgi:hypothetical protein